MARNFNNNTSNYINAGDHAALHLNTAGTDMSLHCWAYFTDNTVEHNLIMQDNGQAANTGAYLLSGVVNASNFVVRFVSQAGGTGIQFGTVVLSTNTWYPIGAAISGTNIRLYVNGANDNGTQAGVIKPIYVGTPAGLKIGVYLDSNSFIAGPMAGNLGDVAIWNVALTDGEMAGLGSGARPSSIRKSALVGWWPLDGLSSPEPELSGNAFNGTIVGTVTSANGPPTTLFTPKPPMFSPFTSAPSAAQIYAFDQMAARFSRNITTIGY